jgi:hypothetical protein
MKHKLILLPSEPNDKGELRAIQIAELTGPTAELAAYLDHVVAASVHAVAAKPDSRRVRVLWHDAKRGHGGPLYSPRPGQEYPSLRALSVELGLKFSSLNQQLSSYKARGFSGAVHAGVAYGYADALAQRPGDAPALDKTGQVVRAASLSVDDFALAPAPPNHEDVSA